MQGEVLYPQKEPSKCRQEPFYWRGGDNFTEQETLYDEFRHARENYKNALEEKQKVERQLRGANEQLEECSGYSNELVSFLNGDPETALEESRLKVELEEIETECRNKQLEIDELKRNQNTSFAGSLESELAVLLIEIRKTRKRSQMESQKSLDMRKQLAALYCTSKYHEVLYSEWKLSELETKNKMLKEEVKKCMTPKYIRESEERAKEIKKAKKNERQNPQIKRPTTSASALSERKSALATKGRKDVAHSQLSNDNTRTGKETLIPSRDESSNSQRIEMSKKNGCFGLKINIKNVERKVKTSKVNHESYIECMIGIIDKLNDAIKILIKEEEEKQNESPEEEAKVDKPTLSEEDIIDTEELKRTFLPSKKHAEKKERGIQEEEEEEDADDEELEKERRRSERRAEKEERKRSIEEAFRREQKRELELEQDNIERQRKKVLRSKTKATIVRPTSASSTNYPRKLSSKQEEPKPKPKPKPKAKKTPAKESPKKEEKPKEKEINKEKEIDQEEYNAIFGDSDKESDGSDNDFSEKEDSKFEKSKKNEDDFDSDDKQEDSFDDDEKSKEKDEDSFEKSKEDSFEKSKEDSFDDDEKSKEKDEDSFDDDEKSKEKEEDSFDNDDKQEDSFEKSKEDSFEKSKEDSFDDDEKSKEKEEDSFDNDDKQEDSFEKSKEDSFDDDEKSKENNEDSFDNDEKSKDSFEDDEKSKEKQEGSFEDDDSFGDNDEKSKDDAFDDDFE